MLLWESLLASSSGKRGTSASDAAVSAAAIKAINPSAQDGVYWIDLPTVGPTQIYCIMNSAYDGGGWMMAMKATRGTTFNYSSNYWTTANTLNPSQTNTNDGDAKFHTMNYFPAKDMMAIFPDMSNGGSIAGSTRGWTWLEKNFVEYLASQLTFNNAFTGTSTASSWQISTDGGSTYTTATARSSTPSDWSFYNNGWLDGPDSNNVVYKHTFNLSSVPTKPPLLIAAAYWYFNSGRITVNGVAQNSVYRGFDDNYLVYWALRQPLSNLTTGSNTITITMFSNGGTGLVAYEYPLTNRDYSLGVPLISIFNDGHPIFFRDAKTFTGWASGSFSSQGGFRWYGLNSVARWGFSWDNSAGEFNSDVFGGIGMSAGNYSAGDIINCCQDTTGINRSARVELYVR